MILKEYYSHLNGFEWLMYHQQESWEEIKATIESVNANQYRTKVSKEKTMPGKLLYSPKELNEAYKEKLTTLGWSESRTSYWVTDNFQLIRKTMYLEPDEQKREIEENKHEAIRSYNQTDFVKNDVAVEVQFGKYSFVAYDLFVKHLAFYVGDKIEVGVEIVPMKSMQKEMSSGPYYYEATLYDLARQGRGVPAVPLVIIGIEP